MTGSAVGINGGEPQSYSQDAPGTVHPGDVLTWENVSTKGESIYYKSVMDFDVEALKEVVSLSPYTVETVAGATVVFIDN